MTGTEAVRRLRAAGWQLVRSGKHAIMEKDGRTLTVSLGAKMSRQAESGIKRALLGRLTATQGWQQRVALLVLAVLLSSCNYDVNGVARPDGFRADGGGDEVGKQTERPSTDVGAADGGVEPMPDAMPEATPVDVKSEAPPVVCDEVANTGCVAPLKCGFSCAAGGMTCITGTTSTMRVYCKGSGADDACGPGMGCASPPGRSDEFFCLFYCHTDADCAGTPGRPDDGGAATCQALPVTEFDGGCSRAGHKVCW